MARVLDGLSIAATIAGQGVRGSLAGDLWVSGSCFFRAPAAAFRQYQVLAPHPMLSEVFVDSFPLSFSIPPLLSVSLPTWQMSTDVQGSVVGFWTADVP